VPSKLAGKSEINKNNLFWKTKLCITEEKAVTVLQDQWNFKTDVSSVFDLFFSLHLSYIFSFL